MGRGVSTNTTKFEPPRIQMISEYLKYMVGHTITNCLAINYKGYCNNLFREGNILVHGLYYCVCCILKILKGTRINSATQ